MRIVDSGRVTYAVRGAMLFMIIALIEGDLPATDAPERMAAMALRMLEYIPEKLQTFRIRICGKKQSARAFSCFHET